MSGIFFGSEPADAKSPADHQCQRRPGHVSTPTLISDRSWPGGKERRRKESPTLKPIAARKPIVDEVAPPDAMRQVQARDDGEPGAEEDADGLAHQDGYRQRPGALLQRAELHSGIHEPEEEQRHLRRIAPEDLELAQRVARSRRGVHEEAGIARGLRKERQDRQKRQRRVQAAPVQARTTRARPVPRNLRPERLHAHPPQAAGHAHRGREHQHAAGQMQVPSRIEQAYCNKPRASHVIASRITSGIAGWCLPKISRAAK